MLTKHWTDCVDYWAVDFDYMSRREIIKVAKNAGMESAVVDVENNPSSPPNPSPSHRKRD